MTDNRRALETRVRNAMIQHALMRWEGVSLLAASFLATFVMSLYDFQLLGLPNILWLLLGLAGYLGLAYSSFTDEETGRRVAESVLRADFSPRRLENKELQAKINEAFDYRSRIAEQMRQRDTDTALRTQLEGVADQFDEWIEEIYLLAQRLDAYYRERGRLEQSRKSATTRLYSLQESLGRARDAQVRTEIEKNIESTQRQIATIETLDNTMARAKLRLENTVTAMATIHSQTLLLSAKDIDGSRYQRLQQDIADEVNELGDILVAMDEVYSESAI